MKMENTALSLHGLQAVGFFNNPQTPLVSLILRFFLPHFCRQC